MKEGAKNRSNRTFPLTLIVFAWAIAIVIRLVQLQLFEHERLLALALEQQQESIEIAAERGVIYDRSLDSLAVSLDLVSVYLNPRQVEDLERTARLLAQALSLDHTELERRLSSTLSGRSFVWIKRKISFKETERVKGLELPGVYFLKEGKRFYPNRELACHLLGFVGTDNYGLYGIEQLYDRELRGKPGRLIVKQDARRSSFSTEEVEPSIPGRSLVLTIDRGIQYIVEQELAAAVESSGALGGTVVVMEPHTGEILAMAAWPPFNPNRFQEYSPEVWRNPAIAEAYEPGSTFKIVAAAAALEEGLARTDEYIDCERGQIRVRGHLFHDHKPFGLLSFSEVIENSSGVGAIKLGLRLGEERLYNYIRRFGFGQKTGIDLPGEHAGLLREPASWSGISIGAISFGQEIGVTPLQIARALCTIANGGFLIKPHVVRSIRTHHGREVYQAEYERTRVISATTAEAMARVLASAVERGTGKAARLSGYGAAGKTGTAQKVIRGVYSRSKFVASFAGFAPLKNPAVAVVVILDEPQGLYYGGQVAAPVFKRIAERALYVLGVPKELERKPEELLLAENGSFADLPLDQPPERSSWEAGPEEIQAIVIHASEGAILMPDFRGKSLREVAGQCAVLGLKPRFTGMGVAVEQIPPAGARVLPGSLCNVWFSRQRKRSAEPGAQQSGF